MRSFGRRYLFQKMESETEPNGVKLGGSQQECFDPVKVPPTTLQVKLTSNYEDYYLKGTRKAGQFCTHFCSLIIEYEFTLYIPTFLPQ